MRDFQEDLAVMVSQGFRLKVDGEGNIEWHIPNAGSVEVDALDLSIRANRACQQLKCETVYDVLEVLPDLINQRNVGVGTLKEIKNKILDVCYSRMTDAQVAKFWEPVLVKMSAQEEKEGVA